MAHANLSVRIDETDKKNFETFCNETGMNVSTAVNMFVKAVLREQQLPFVVKTDPFYSSENMARLQQSIHQMQTTGGTIREINLDD
jgi:addiction module antitoxin, RelB/DinJ family